jgi:ParB family chromosome partitioning protein
VSAGDRRARLVGEEAYVAAGGRVERDLFSEEEGARWLDIALLERLATEKMERLAAEIAASSGLAFVRPTLEGWAGYDMTRRLQRAQLETPPLSEEERTEVEALEAEAEALAGELEDEERSDEARQAAERRIAEIDDRTQALTDKPPVIPDELKPRVGTFLLLDEQGRPRLDTSYFAEPLDEPEQADRVGEDAAEASDCAGKSAGGVAQEPRKSAGLSQALADELAIQRRDILAVHVAVDPAFAADLAIFLMVDREAGYSSERSGSSLLALAPTDPVFGFKTPDAAATRAKKEAGAALDRSWTSAATPAERFDSFRALPDEARAAWLGHAVARTLEASLNLPGGRTCAFHDHLGRLLGIEVPKWWRPTGANYFDRVPKAAILEALQEVGGLSFASRYAKGKKAELAQSAERIFAGDFIGEVEVKERALAWVPEAMRFAAPPAAEPAADDLPPWEEEPGADGAEAPPAQRGETQAEEPASGAEAIMPERIRSAEPAEPAEQERGDGVAISASPEVGEGLEQAA